MTKNQILLIQHCLGLEVDGINGPITQKAYLDFKKEIGLSLRADLTNKHLRKRLLMGSPQNKIPVWLRYAQTFEGLREWPGRKHNPKILQWFIDVGHRWVKDDERPWCAAFVGAVLEECGIKSTRKLQARSYTKWGETLSAPCVGCIVVFWRGSRIGFKGHVGFVVGKDKHDNLMVLGGNQGNAVNVRKFKQDRVLGYYLPFGGEYTFKINYDLPIIDTKVKFSKKES